VTTTSLAVSFSEDRLTALPVRRAAGDMLAMVVLTLALLFSFLQYCFERNDVIRLVPVALLIMATFVLLLVSTQEKRRAMFLGVGRAATIALITIVSVPPLISSFYRTNSYSFQYGVVMVVTLIAVRILLSGIGLEGLLLCYFWATTTGILIVVGITFDDLLASIGSTRYAPSFFDPNRIGFFAVAAIPAQLWFATRGTLNRFALIAAIVCVCVLVAASSRGSIGALLLAVAVISTICLLRLLRFSSFAISRNKLFVALTFLCVLAVIIAAEQPAFDSAGNYLRTKLELDSRVRGLNSGFTGRTTNWAAVVDVLPKTFWLSGNGYRSSEQDFTFSVDNGYLAGSYELGVFATVIVVAKYLLFLGLLIAAYVTRRSASSACLLALASTLVIFLANAFVHRVLFGSGDPASLLALFMFVSNRQDIFGNYPRSRSSVVLTQEHIR
jgi:hypothetical protein